MTSEIARLDMKKSGTLLRFSDLKTASMTNKFPMHPKVIIKVHMVVKITSDPGSNSVRPLSVPVSELFKVLDSCVVEFSAMDMMRQYQPFRDGQTHVSFLFQTKDNNAV